MEYSAHTLQVSYRRMTGRDLPRCSMGKETCEWMMDLYYKPDLAKKRDKDAYEKNIDRIKAALTIFGAAVPSVMVALYISDAGQTTKYTTLLSLGASFVSTQISVHGLLRDTA